MRGTPWAIISAMRVSWERGGAAHMCYPPSRSCKVPQGAPVEGKLNRDPRNATPTRGRGNMGLEPRGGGGGRLERVGGVGGRGLLPL